MYDSELDEVILDTEDDLTAYDLVEFEAEERKKMKLRSLAQQKQYRQWEQNLAGNAVAAELQRQGVTPEQWNQLLASQPQKASQIYAGITGAGAGLYVKEILKGANVTPKGTPQRVQQPAQRQTKKESDGNVDAVLRALFPDNDPMLRY